MVASSGASGLAAACAIATFSGALIGCGRPEGGSVGDPNCKPCEGCPGSSKRVYGTYDTIESPQCKEGQVASVESFRSSSDGKYQVSVLDDGYKHIQASTPADSDVTCYQPLAAVMPIISARQQIRVRLSCRSSPGWFNRGCEFKFDIKFGCKDTGVLVKDAGEGGVQVLSDVDDTIVCPRPICTSKSECTANGDASDLKHFLAGKDRRLESGEMYPGVAELQLALALGPGYDPRTQQNSYKFKASRTRLLSARPKEGSIFVAIKQDSKLNKYFEKVGDRTSQGNWGINTDDGMYGTILDGISFKEMGQTKGKHYNAVSEASPNTRYAFLGDNGQGDACGAQSMLESKNEDRMLAALIHLTETREKELKKCEQPEGGDFDLNLPEGGFGDRVHYFKTHADAAAWALQKSLISCCSARSVYDAVKEWQDCRCRGEGAPPPNQGCKLPTGFGDPATRADTVAYCSNVETDQVALEAALANCEGNPPTCPSIRALDSEALVMTLV